MTPHRPKKSAGRVPPADPQKHKGRVPPAESGAHVGRVPPAESPSWQTHSVQETHALGEAIGRALHGGLVVGLVGQLGAGKTQLVKGMAAGNAVDDVRRVTSPTFTLIHEYPGRLRLYHVDAYRLRSAEDLLKLGFDELVQPDAAVVVEWADRVKPALPPDSLWITMTVTGKDQRSLSVTAYGESAASCLQCLVAVLH